MMKKLIPAAVLMAMGAAAQADVTLYGLIDMSYGKNEIAFPGQKDDFFSGGDNGSSQGNSTSRFGLKGSTSVGSGIKANFKLESAGIRSNGAVGMDGQAFFNRQAWAGFSGSFGEVRLGKQDDVIFQTVIGYDANGAANAASAWANAGTNIFGVGRQDRSLQYISPKLADAFTVHVGFQPKGNVASAEDNFGAALNYAGGPLSVSVATQSKTTIGGESVSVIVGSYDFGMAKVALGYADGGKAGKGTSFGIVAPVAGFNVGLNVSKKDDTNGTTATEFFVNKEIFKSTYAYFDYGNVDKPKSRDAYAVGVIYVF